MLKIIELYCKSEFLVCKFKIRKGKIISDPQTLDQTKFLMRWALLLYQKPKKEEGRCGKVGPSVGGIAWLEFLAPCGSHTLCHGLWWPPTLSAPSHGTCFIQWDVSRGANGCLAEHLRVSTCISSPAFCHPRDNVPRLACLGSVMPPAPFWLTTSIYALPAAHMSSLPLLFFIEGTASMLLLQGNLHGFLIPK